jgi:hypothetical protein
LIVPRDAVLPEEGGEYVLYTVKDDHAVKRTVRVGLDDGRDVQVIGEDLKEGELVVVSGNYELEDQMSVKSREATAKSESATQPATTQSAMGPTTAPAAWGAPAATALRTGGGESDP